MIRLIAGLRSPSRDMAALTSSHSSYEARAARTEVRHLEDRLDRLELVCAAMWQLLKEKTDFTDAELNEAIVAVDMADGRADGKLVPQQIECGACGRRRLTSVRNVCLWCGEPMPTDAFGRRIPSNPEPADESAQE